MSSDPPEFHTETLSPLSPLPVHPPEPANIPVLRNQIDPVFNMTSTHINSDNNDPALQTASNPPVQPDSPSSDSSFTDAYKEQSGTEVNKEVEATQNATAVDDYAMTFDSDGEEQAQPQDTTQTHPDLKAEPVSSNAAADNVSASDVAQESSLTNLQNASNSLASQTASHIDDATTNEPISETPLAQLPQTDQTQSSTPDEPATDGVDIQQLLDNITANAEKHEVAAQSASVAAPSLPAHSSLPPRPQIPQARPNNDAPSFAAHGIFPPASTSYRPPGVAPSLVAAGAPGTSTDPRNGLPPPPGTSFAPPTTIPGHEQMNISIDHRDDTDNPEKRWGPEIQKLYDIFLEEERKNVTDGTWEKFPVGSRLFVGNLASEQVTKRDVFHIFHRYGRIAQISIKQAYGFVQYYSAESCQSALINQEGAELRGKKIHLEVSKPQKSHNQQRNSVGGTNDRNAQNDRNRQGRNNERQDRDARGGRDDYSRSQRPARDDYRPRRSPTPPRINDRNRDPYGPPRGGRDSYGRDRRERSPPPYDHRGFDNYRERDFSPPRRDSYPDPDFQIPHRDPRDVPDIQFIVVEQLNRDFVSWCENEIRSRGIKTETMFLSPRLSLDAVIQRQIVEGVLAVSQLDLRAQSTSKISLRVFNRSAGANNVRFDEYQGLDPKIAAELVLRDKQAQQAPPAIPPSYAPPPQQYGQPPQLPYQQPHIPIPPSAAQAPNLAGLANLDNATLQKLLGGLNTAQQQNSPAVSQNSSIDLVSLLGMLNQQQAAQQQQPSPQQPLYAAPPQQPQQQYGNYAVQSPVNGTAYGAPNAQGMQSAPGNAQSVQNIMAALAKARQ